MTDTKPILGTARFTEGGKIIEFDRLDAGEVIVRNRIVHGKTVTEEVVTPKTQAYCVDRLFNNSAQNSYRLEVLHPDDQEALKNAMNTVVGVVKLERVDQEVETVDESQRLIDRLGATGLVTPRL